MNIDTNNPIRIYFGTVTQFVFTVPTGEESSTFKLSIREKRDPNTTSMADATGTVSGSSVIFSVDSNTQEFQRVCKNGNTSAWLEIYKDSSTDGKVYLQREIFIAGRAGSLDGQPPVPVERYILNPTGGAAGQVLTKTATGAEWVNATNGGTVKKVSGISPDSNGNVTLTSGDIGALSRDGREFVSLSGTSVTSAGKVYEHTLADGDTFTFFTPESGKDGAFELDLTQPSTAVSFTLPTVTWKFGVPDFTTGGKTYYLRFRYIGGVWQGWTTPEMSEYVQAVQQFDTAEQVQDPINWSDEYGSFFNVRHSSAIGCYVTIGGTYNTKHHLALNGLTLNINIKGYVAYNGHRLNTAGGFCVTDASTGSLTVPGDVIAHKADGTTEISMRDLLARIEALEGAQ